MCFHAVDVARIEDGYVVVAGPGTATINSLPLIGVCPELLQFCFVCFVD